MLPQQMADALSVELAEAPGAMPQSERLALLEELERTLLEYERVEAADRARPRNRHRDPVQG
ncbi:hypothetical protein [Bradyrhizobium sp. LA7.1]|uniref:hypothetical protein n=1 Tax=Bradyrhizobium sp. LA7.1 TaxID=3156324 RepID=UPI003397BC38